MVALAVLAVKQVRAAPVATEMQERLASRVALAAMAATAETPASRAAVERVGLQEPAELAAQAERLVRMVLQVWLAMVVTAEQASPEH
jgi:hypothetical protein